MKTLITKHNLNFLHTESNFNGVLHQFSDEIY